MEIRFQNSPQETRNMDTGELRKNFLLTGMMKDEDINLVYSHYDRMIIGGIRPVNRTLLLPNPAELRADFFLQRREMGIINVGGPAAVIADKKEYNLAKLDCLYLGRGTTSVKFRSRSKKDPGVLYILSAPAHHKYPNRFLSKEKASPVDMGDITTSNKRTIYKYIHEAGIKSCQLVMGLTILQAGSVWNSVPPHTHTRRMEVYFYFDIPGEHRVFHFMGERGETRHFVMANHEAVISPPWSMHFGCGTSSYGFIWGMAGENQAFSDMDPAPVALLK
jgi:4-deoxy-L-threo-5-hexosulose-uronate ketol-isomerase